MYVKSATPRCRTSMLRHTQGLSKPPSRPHRCLGSLRRDVGPRNYLDLLISSLFPKIQPKPQKLTKSITKNNSQMVHNPTINTRGEVKRIPNTQQVFIHLNTSNPSSRRNFIHHKPRIHTQIEDSILILYN